MVNLPIEYSDKAVTPFGGMALMKRFLDQVGIRQKLGTLDLPEPGSNRGYSSEQIIESFWLNVWTGASRYVHCNWLREDRVIRDIFGYRSMPSQSTYSRFFGKFSQPRNHAVFPELQRWFFEQMNLGAVTVDFDSTSDYSRGQTGRCAAVGVTRITRSWLLWVKRAWSPTPGFVLAIRLHPATAKPL